MQKQYTSGSLSIAKWAEITNAHLFPGPLIVTALKQAAATAIAAYNTSVHTDISVGSPIEPSEPPFASSSSNAASRDLGSPDRAAYLQGHGDVRKQSVVSVTHTISTQTEPMSPQATPIFDEDIEGGAGAAGMGGGGTPFLRGLLLIAEMSSEGNFLTGEYTDTCVEVARQHRDFVLGFIAQRSLNKLDGDNFITMTPGVSIPAAGQEGKVGGDGLGQQYNSPRSVVLQKGCDVIIVGRGILNAHDRSTEAERYRQEAWKAYEERIAGR